MSETDGGLLAELGTRPGRLFLRSDAVRVGANDRDLLAWQRVGLVRRLARGVYVAGPEPEARDDRHLELVRAMLISHPNVVASHHSALLLHGISTYGVSHARAYAQWVSGGATLAQGPFRLLRAHRAAPVVRTGEGLAVAPAWAVAQTAARFGVAAGVVAADHALHEGIVSMDQLVEVVAELEGTRGIGRAREMLDRCDARSESVGESRLRLVLHDLGFRVVPQFEVYDGGRHVARADFRLDGSPVLIEFDGMLKYRREHGQQALEEEKAREDRCRALGWFFVRVVWPMLDRPEEIRREILLAGRRAA